MLASGKVVSFVLTKDYDQARSFYEGKLGFEFVSQGVCTGLKVGGHFVRISKVPDFTPCGARSWVGK
jgi:catechol 2,3-dioxygenase-like lactoylglutathione lyase family enzyme